MTKYARRPHLTPGQEQEIFPILDKALSLPFGKAILHKCPPSRADYLSRILNGERNRAGVESLTIYLPEDPLYGKGIYYHLVIEIHPKGLLVANVEEPPISLTWRIIECAATKKPVSLGGYKVLPAQAKLNRLKARHEEVRAIYIDCETKELKSGITNPEDMIVVDIDINPASPGVSLPAKGQKKKV